MYLKLKYNKGNPHTQKKLLMRAMEKLRQRMTLQNILLTIAVVSVLVVLYHVFVRQSTTGSQAETTSTIDAGTVARAKDVVARFQAKVAAHAAAAPKVPSAVTTV